MIDDITRIGAEAPGRIAAANTLDELRAVEGELLGKKGELTALKKGLGGLEPEPRRAAGLAMNDVRAAIESTVAERRASLESAARALTLAAERLDLTGPVAVLVGSESHGLPPEAVAAADHLLTIPLDPGVESLNAAVAGAVVLFEAARQRRLVEGSGAGGDGPGTDWTTEDSTDRLGDR